MDKSNTLCKQCPYFVKDVEFINGFLSFCFLYTPYAQKEFSLAEHRDLLEEFKKFARLRFIEDYEKMRISIFYLVYKNPFNYIPNSCLFRLERELLEN